MVNVLTVSTTQKTIVHRGNQTTDRIQGAALVLPAVRHAGNLTACSCFGVPGEPCSLG
jgi:hypothetical protein